MDGDRMSFAEKDPRVSLRFHGYGLALKEFVAELSQAFQYWIGALALLGLWRRRGRGGRPIDRFVLLFCILYSLTAIQVAARVGYLAPRHLLPLVVVGIGWAGEGALALGALARKRIRNSLPGVFDCLSAFRIPKSALARLPIAVAALACLPPTLTPLHASRLGHRQAAHWLASQEDRTGAVLDTRGWTQFYSGRKTYAYDQAKKALGDPQLSYIVVERRELEYDSRRSRTLRDILARAGERVAQFTPGKSSHQTVEIYRWRPERFIESIASQRRRSRAN